MAYRRLVDEDKAVAVLGTHFSNISLAIAPVAEQKKVPVLGQAVEPKVTIPAPGKLNKYHFLAQPSCIEQGQMMARFAFEELGARKAAVLADKSNSYSISQAEHFAEYFKRKRWRVTDFVGVRSWHRGLPGTPHPDQGRQPRGYFPAPSMHSPAACR